MRVAIGKNRPIINYLASKNVDYSDCHDGGLLFLHAITSLLSDENEVPRDAAEQGWSDTKQSVDETASEYRLRFNRMCKTLDRAQKQGAFTKSPSAKAKRFCTTCTKNNCFLFKIQVFSNLLTFFLYFSYNWTCSNYVVLIHS